MKPTHEVRERILSGERTFFILASVLMLSVGLPKMLGHRSPIAALIVSAVEEVVPWIKLHHFFNLTWEVILAKF